MIVFYTHSVSHGGVAGCGLNGRILVYCFTVKKPWYPIETRWFPIEKCWFYNINKRWCGRALPAYLWVKIRNFVLKTRNCVLKTRNCELKMMNVCRWRRHRVALRYAFHDGWRPSSRFFCSHCILFYSNCTHFYSISTHFYCVFSGRRSEFCIQNDEFCIQYARLFL